MRTQISEYKYNPYSTSSQVKTILHGKGYSHLFNWNDFEEFKRRTKKAFNQAVKIADLFLSQADTPSDFADYTFNNSKIYHYETKRESKHTREKSIFERTKRPGNSFKGRYVTQL